MRITILLMFALCSASVTLAETPSTYQSRETWLKTVPKSYHRRPEYVFVDADPNLPCVLLIGDSISMSYTAGVRRRLAGTANVYRAPDNCRSTRQTLGAIETYLGDVDWDVICFNWGIHDITHKGPDGKATPPPAGRLQVGPDEYRDNFEAILRRLEKTGAKLVWITTTPVGKKAEAKGYRRDLDATLYNKTAAEIVAAQTIATCDLNSLVKPRVEELLADGIHFNRKGVDILADAVAEAIRSQLTWFREDFTETPPEIPVKQKHLANPKLKLLRLGPGEASIKRSFHENVPGDPYYVWSGLCPGRWAVAFEHTESTADLDRFGKIRWRTKQAADRVLFPVVKTKDGWLIADRGTPTSKDWTVDEIDLTECRWFRFDAEKIAKGESVENPDLSEVSAAGCTDLMPGGQSKACSRLDWIEVYGEVNKGAK